MPHALFQKTMAYVGEPPWHGLGTRVPANVSADAMIKAANLNWHVHKFPAPGARLIASNPPIYERNLIVRDPVGRETEPVALALVGSTYEVLQNAEAFSFFEPFVSNKWGEFHTAGALRNGERVWVLAQLRGEIIVGRDDVVQRFILLANSHDGSGAASVRFTPVRVVCQNTLNLAARGKSGVISIRHTKNIALNLARAQAQQLKKIIDKAFADAENLFGAMALRKMGAQNVDHFLQLLFPRSKTQLEKSQEPARWTRVKAILDVEDVTPPKTKDTLWALYNAIVRDEDYREFKEGAPDGRLDRVWFGSGHDLKIKALEAARQHLRTAA